jgi:tetratricopeptide (TPR) repeat protein
VAAALVVLDRTAESEPIYKEALNQSRRAFGDEHPNTITACNNYAFCLLRLDRLAEAEPYFVEVYERGMRSLPKAHPARGMILNGYAELLVKLNRQQQAAPLQEQYVAFCRQVHGADHSSTKHAEKRLASIRDALAGHEVPTAASTAPTTTPERRP